MRSWHGLHCHGSLCNGGVRHTRGCSARARPHTSYGAGISSADASQFCPSPDIEPHGDEVNYLSYCGMVRDTDIQYANVTYSLYVQDKTVISAGRDQIIKIHDERYS